MSGIGGQVSESKWPVRKFVPITGLWLRKEGNHAVVLVELEGQWVEVCREHTAEGPFSHIVEPAGIDARAEKAFDEGKARAHSAAVHQILSPEKERV